MDSHKNKSKGGGMALAAITFHCDASPVNNAVKILQGHINTRPDSRELIESTMAALLKEKNLVQVEPEPTGPADIRLKIHPSDEFQNLLGVLSDLPEQKLVGRIS